MKAATIRQLRHDFGSVLRWVEDGEDVEISKHGRVVAVLKPPRASARRKVQRPDFAARLKARDGKRALPSKTLKAILDENRGRA
jgi:prevent-host-death family protein